MVRKAGHSSRLVGWSNSGGPFEDIALITDNFAALRRLVACLTLIGVGAGLGACSHMQHLWPWHHAPAAPPPVANELVVVPAVGATAPALPQTWDRNALRVDLTGIAGEGELKLSPAQGHAWPIRLEFAVRPGSFRHLEVRGEQRVIMSVPDAGAVTVLPVPQGLYAPRTGELTLRYGP
jgi:hypothetical protein